MEHNGKGVGAIGYIDISVCFDANKDIGKEADITCEIHSSHLLLSHPSSLPFPSLPFFFHFHNIYDL